MAELAKIADDRFAALLNSIEPPRVPSVSAERERLREHVALLSAFDAGMLPSLRDAGAESELGAFLTEDCERVGTRKGQRWSLRENVRVEALAGLDRRGRLVSFPGATDEADTACRMALAYIRGSAPDLDRLTLAELRGTAEAAGWLSGARRGDPVGRPGTRRAGGRGDARPLRSLVAEGFFAGRPNSTPVRLRGGPTTEPASTGVFRRVRRCEDHGRPALLIYGPVGWGSRRCRQVRPEHVDAGPATGSCSPT